VQVLLKVRHGSLDADVQDAITSKAEKLLTFFDRLSVITVTISFEKGNVKAEILVDAEHKHNFFASDTDSVAVTAFDKAMQRMEQQLRKYKEKIQDHRRDKPLDQIAGGGQIGES
jgi:putative sigma-54 modulation protein